MNELARVDEHKPAAATEPARVPAGRILVTGPDPVLPGGVTELYRILDLDGAYGWDHLVVTYGEPGKLSKLTRVLRVATRLVRIAPRYDAVLLNPSLDWKSVLRDGLLIWIASLRGSATVVFWHGWHWSVMDTIMTRPVLRWLFRHTFGRADRTLVLDAAFAAALTPTFAGLDAAIEVFATTADRQHIDRDPFGPPYARSGKRRMILIMTRILVNKGVFVALKAFESLQREGRDDIDLVIAGTGMHLDLVRRCVRDNGIRNVSFPGYVSGEQKHALLKSADVYLFPTWYREGMPLSVVEAVTYGIPVIARPVASIPKLVVDGETGLLSDSRDPAVFADLVRRLLDDEPLRARMARAAVAHSDRFHPHAIRRRLLDVVGEAAADRQANAPPVALP